MTREGKMIEICGKAQRLYWVSELVVAPYLDVSSALTIQKRTTLLYLELAPSEENSPLLAPSRIGPDPGDRRGKTRNQPPRPSNLDH